MSLAQQRLWFIAQLSEEASRAYHISLRLRLHGELDRVALKSALDSLVERHESLRTRFVLVDGVALQQIEVAGAGFALQERDLHEVSAGAPRIQQLIVAEAGAAFDLAAGPLIRGQLIRLSEREHLLLLTMHHIVSDGWSMGVFFRDLTTLYGAYSRGASNPLPPLEIQYADYALWQRQWLQGERLQQQGQYWQTNLAGISSPLTVPSDHARGAVQSHAGARMKVVLDGPLAAGLKALSQRHGTTLFMTLLGGWAALLSRLSNQEEVVIGTPDSQPQPRGDRRSDRVLRQHDGAAGGCVE